MEMDEISKALVSIFTHRVCPDCGKVHHRVDILCKDCRKQANYFAKAPIALSGPIRKGMKVI